MRIKRLYSELIDNWQNYQGSRHFTVEEWHGNYRKFHDEVASMRNRLNNGGKLDTGKDEVFLEQLLLKEYNSIAHADKGGITEIQFKNFIDEPKIIKAIENIIKTPSAQMNSELGDAVRQCNIDNNHRSKMEQLIKNNWLIVNRVAAACTDKVSSTVAPRCFIDVFGMLNGLLLTPYKSPLKRLNEQDWFMENLHLMSELQKIFPAEDPLLLSIFVWEVYRYLDDLPA